MHGLSDVVLACAPRGLRGRVLLWPLLLAVAPAFAQKQVAPEKQFLTQLAHSQVASNMKLFYTGKAGNVTPSTTFRRADLVSMQDALQQFMQIVLAEHQSFQSDLTAYFHAPFDGKPTASVVLLDIDHRGPPLKAAAQSNGKTKEVRVTAAFLQGLFESSIIDALHRVEVPDYSADVLSTPAMQARVPILAQTNCDERACVQRFSEFVDLLVRGKVPDQAATFAVSVFNHISARYFGTLIFTLSHELGHLVFEHHKHVACDAPSCTIYHGDELAADRYASYLLTLVLGTFNGTAIAMFDNYTGTSNYLGYPEFFENVYPRLGYDEADSTSLCACEYPSAEERQDAANTVARDALASVGDIKERIDRMELAGKIQHISEKYARTPAPTPMAPAVQPGADRPGDPASPLFPISVGKRIGYMDSAGTIRIQPAFEYARRFSEGLALVEVPKKRKVTHVPGTLAGEPVQEMAFTPADRGFIDRSGKLLFRVNFPENAAANSSTLDGSSVGNFHDGRSLVEFVTPQFVHSFGYLDNQGRVVIKPDYDFAQDFSEGLASVTLSSNKFGTAITGFIRPDGTFAIQPRLRNSRSFHEGLAAIRDPKSEKWGFMDQSGTLVIDYTYDNAWDFSEGFALVGIGDTRRFISRTKDFIGQPVTTAGKFSQGLVAIDIGGTPELWSPYLDSNTEATGGQWGFMDKTGSIVIPPQFSFARDFSEGLAAVNIGGKLHDNSVYGGKWGFIDSKGTLVIPAVYSDVDSDFHGGLAFVEQGDDKVYIDKHGKHVGPSPERSKALALKVPSTPRRRSTPPPSPDRSKAVALKEYIDPRLSLELRVFDSERHPLAAAVPVHVKVVSAVTGQVVAETDSTGATHSFDQLPYHGNAAAGLTVSVVRTDTGDQAERYLTQEIMVRTQRVDLMLLPKKPELHAIEWEQLQKDLPRIAKLFSVNKPVGQQADPYDQLASAAPDALWRLLSFLALMESHNVGKQPAIEYLKGFNWNSASINGQLSLWVAPKLITAWTDAYRSVRHLRERTPRPEPPPPVTFLEDGSSTRWTKSGADGAWERYPPLDPDDARAMEALRKAAGVRTRARTGQPNSYFAQWILKDLRVGLDPAILAPVTFNLLFRTDHHEMIDDVNCVELILLKYPPAELPFWDTPVSPIKTYVALWYAAQANVYWRYNPAFVIRSAP